MNLDHRRKVMARDEKFGKLGYESDLKSKDLRSSLKYKVWQERRS